MHDQQHGRLAHRTELLEIRRLVRQVVVQQGIQDHPVGAREAQRIAVRLGARHRHGGDDGLAAGTVFDDDILLERLAHPVGQRAGGDIGQAARREAHQQAHRPGGKCILLGPDRARDQGQRGKRAQGMTAGESHTALQTKAMASTRPGKGREATQ
ncbi:hypothetical protein D3C86_1622920 [compost metagenome]